MLCRCVAPFACCLRGPSNLFCSGCPLYLANNYQCGRHLDSTKSGLLSGYPPVYSQTHPLSVRVVLVNGSTIFLVVLVACWASCLSQSTLWLTPLFSATSECLLCKRGRFNHFYLADKPAFVFRRRSAWSRVVGSGSDDDNDSSSEDDDDGRRPRRRRRRPTTDDDRRPTTTTTKKKTTTTTRRRRRLAVFFFTHVDTT